MITNILIKAPDGSEVVLDEADVRALHSFHIREAESAPTNAGYVFHRERADELYRCLRDAVDRTETAV